MRSKRGTVAAFLRKESSAGGAAYRIFDGFFADHAPVTHAPDAYQKLKFGLTNQPELTFAASIGSLRVLTLPHSEGVEMPSSAVRKFIDPDLYFSGIRNLQIEGIVTKRGEFRAESTRIDLHRLWMHRFDESLPRIMRITPGGKRSLILFATDPSQQTMQVSGIETSQAQFAVLGLDWPYYLRSSAVCGWGTMSLTPEDLAATSEAIIGRPVAPPAFPRWTGPLHLLSPDCCSCTKRPVILRRALPIFWRSRRWREPSRRLWSKQWSCV